ncbi:MAG: alpha-amylase family protein [Bacteroidia bacterium]
MYDPHLHQRIETTLTKYSKKLKGKAANTFAARLGANLGEIRKSFESLYGEQDGVEKHFGQLLEILAEAAGERPAALRKRDSQRELQPDWLTDPSITGMALYVDRFAGDINGVADKLDYLEDLGVNWLHLLPLLDCPEGSNDGGYAIRDYRKVDERLGTMDDLRGLTEKLHEKDMLLTLDLQLNHTSDQHEWAQKARQGDERYQRFYYTYPDRRVPDTLEETMPEVFPNSSPGNFTYIPETDSWVMTVFHDYQWDLNYRNPEVFLEMLKVMLFMANLGVDILRLGTPAYTWKRIGTSCQNLWEAHLLLQLFKACTQVVAPAMVYIADAIVAPREIIRYFGEGSKAGHECEVAYNATFMALLWDALATKDARLLRQAMNRLPNKPLGTTWINYVRSHDDIGLVFDDADIYAVGYEAPSHRRFLLDFYSGKYKSSKCKGAIFSHNLKTGDARISGSLAALTGLEYAVQEGNDEDAKVAADRITMMHALILAYGGLPMLYYGDEIGMPNDYSYVKDDDKAYDNRWMHRPVIDWKLAAQREDTSSIPGQIFNSLKHLIAVRKESPEFADLNNINWEKTDNDHVLGFLRWDKAGRRTLVLANFSDESQQLSIGTLRRCGLNPSLVKDRIGNSELALDHEVFLIEGYQCVYLSENHD